MNTVIRTVAAVAALAVTGLASASGPVASTLSWDCARAGAPGLGEVKELFETSSNHYASQLRARLQSRLRAECQRGAERILVVLARPSSSDEVRLAAAPTETAVANGARAAE
jgi:hypothetical protein